MGTIDVKRPAAFAAAAASALALSAGTLLNSEYIKTTGDAELGKFYGYRQYGEGPGDLAFSNTLARARAARVPMFTFWGSPDCEWCSKATDLFNTQAFQSYISSKRMVFAHFKSGNRNGPAPGDVASIQAYSYITEIGKPWSWPYFRLEWAKPDGTTVTTNGSMCVSSTAVYSLEGFKALIENFTAGYDNLGTLDFRGGAFAVSDSAKSRLEAVEGVTKSVWIPLKRSATVMDCATNAVLKAILGGATNEIAVAWAAGETNKFVETSIPLGKAGETVSLLLEDGDGQAWEKSAIHVVADPGATQENPLWIGERTPDALGWGEWTMDLDAATQKVAAAAANGEKAYTLALVGGELWCPDCEGMRDNLLSKDEFAGWAKSNRVALVLVDIPPKPTTMTPTMVSWSEYLEGDSAISGAAYLSRKGVSPAEAAAVYGRNATLCYETWNAPYEGRSRPWVPTMFLLRPDGTVCGKLLGDRKYPNNSKYESTVDFTVAAYMRRFDELFALAEDPGEWDNNDWTTTTEAFAADGGEWQGTLSALDGNTRNPLNQRVVDVAEVTGLGKDEELTVVFSCTGGGKAKPSLLSVAGTSIVATAEGEAFALSGESVWTVTNTAAGAERSFIVLEGADDSFFAYNNTGGTVCRYAASASAALVCGEKTGVREVVPGTLKVKIEEGSVYRFEGVAVEVSEEDFKRIGTAGKYLALRSGVATIEIAEAGTLEYQLWKSGRISFAAGAVAASERGGSAVLELKREGGVSGAAKVRVTLAGGDAPSVADDPENGRFAWDGDVTLVWPEGVDTNQYVTVAIFDRSPRWDGDQTAVFAVAAEEDSDAVVEEPDVCTLTIVEEDVKSVGFLELLPDEARFSADGVAYARRGEVLTFDVARVGGAASTVSASVSATGGASVAPSEARWVGNSADATRTFSLTVPETAEAGSWIVAQVVPDGIAMRRGVDRIFVFVLGDEAPAFEGDGTVARTLYRHVPCEVEAEISGKGYSSYRVEMVSGALPGGVSAAVEGNLLRFSGAPSGTGKFASVWRVAGVNVDGSRVDGGTLRAAFEVVAVADVCEAADDAGFPAARIVRYSGYEADATNGLVAVASLAANEGGRMRLTVDAAGGRSVLASASWSAVDSEAVAAELEGDGCEATVRWVARGDGTCGFEGELRMDGEEAAAPLVFFPECGAGALLDPGAYLVDFAPADDGEGHAFAAIRVARGAAGRQSASYAGMFPDGRTFSGSSTVLPGGDGFCLVPLMKRSASGVIRSLLKIATAASGDKAFFDEYNHSVSNAYPTFWDAPGGGSATMCGQGGFYKAGMDLESVCLLSDLVADYTLGVDESALYSSYGLRLADGVVHGLASVVGDRIYFAGAAAAAGRTTFSFSRATGVFSGKFGAEDAAGRARTVLYRGVAMPNWGEECEAGCGRGPRPGPFKPFGVGTAYIGGRTGVPGAKFELKPVQDED